MLDQGQLASSLVPFVKAFAGGGSGAVSSLGGDASMRRYHRVTVEGGTPESAMVMELPEDPLRSEEASEAAPPSELPFLNVHRYLSLMGIPVPAIYQVNMMRGWIALEDLGDTTLERHLRSLPRGSWRACYSAAVRIISAIQHAGIVAPDPGCVAFQRRFDRGLLLWELEHFREWLLEKDRNVRLSEREAQIVSEAFDWISGTLADAPQVLVHRDFQSRNLMMTGNGLLKLIDFQDALLGPGTYDLVALLRDSYVELDSRLVADILGEFLLLVQPNDPRDLAWQFHVQTVQRKLKDAGRFVFIDRVRRNSQFLQWIPLSLRYVAEALPHVTELALLAEVLARHLPEMRAELS